MSKSFKEILEKVKALPKKTVSVAVAQDSEVLMAVKAAKEKGIAESVLFGDGDKIKAIADELGMNLEDYKIVDIKDPIEAAHEAVKYVHDGKADMYMKGLMETKDFLRSVLDKEVGLRSGRPLSHVCVFELKKYDKLLFFTDVAFVPYPTLEEKVSIIENTVEICRAVGIDCPKVAPLTAVEVVNPKMPETLEAAELTKMNEEGKIKNCIVDGPLSLDLATCPKIKVWTTDGRWSDEIKGLDKVYLMKESILSQYSPRDIWFDPSAYDTCLSGFEIEGQSFLPDAFNGSYYKEENWDRFWGSFQANIKKQLSQVRFFTLPIVALKSLQKKDASLSEKYRQIISSAKTPATTPVGYCLLLQFEDD